MLMAETQAAQNRRRSERVKLNMAVHVLAENEERQQIRVEGKTLGGNAHGGVVEMTSDLHMGQSFFLTKSATGGGRGCRVGRGDELGMGGFSMRFWFERPGPQI